MPDQSRELWVGDAPRRPTTKAGKTMHVPALWDFLAAGDAALTRRVKAAGPAWVVKQQRGRRVMSQGVWASKATIETLRAQLTLEREDPRYQKKLAASRLRRANQQVAYAADFERAVHDFLDFAPCHAAAAATLAKAIAQHATPVGSGTVARTRRIPIERRAEAATIAWLRHQTSAYDEMKIPRVKGKRREVRRLIAQRSRELLRDYRAGAPPRRACPLRAAMAAHEPVEA